MLCALTLGLHAKEKLQKYVSVTYPQDQVCHSISPFQEAIKQLDAYFAGDLVEFDLKLTPHGTPFQKSVWAALQSIPYGRTISYGDLANQLNNPEGMRAVGAANGQNPIPIIIPCHRVIASDGSLGGYTGGLEIKHQLLELERQKNTPMLF
jgi:O-6-methylguanine DNA methyltransferase